MSPIIYIIILIYFINFFFGLKFIFKKNLNLSNMIYSFLLIIIFPFLTPIIYFLIFLDERVRLQLIKKRHIDEIRMEKMNLKAISQHNDVRIFTNGEILFDDIFEEIKRAKHYIHLSFFTFDTDQIGKTMIAKLEEKLKENVDVKILYDPLGSMKMKKKYFKTYLKLGGELIPFVKLKRRFFNINYRNHRKTLIIDNRISYIGGYNIGDMYLGRDKKLGLWVDCELKIIGQASSEIEKRFLLDYMYAIKKDIDINQYLIPQTFDGNHQIEMISSGADINEINSIEHKLIEYIYRARDYIYIQSPYLILNDGMIRALKYAALKGVEIKIMLPNKNDHPFVLQATKAFANELIDDKIHIYLFNKNAFLHSKVFLCDDHYVTIGTMNFDIRSFKYDLEINAFINNKDVAIFTKTMFNKQLTYCTEYTQNQILQQSIWTKMKFNLCKLLSSIL